MRKFATEARVRLGLVASQTNRRQLLPPCFLEVDVLDLRLNQKSVTAGKYQMTTLIEQLASAKGIANDYVDAWGNPALVSQESKAAMLGAMGYRVDNEAALQLQLEEEKRTHWAQPLDPVLVMRSGETISFELRLPISQVNDELTWEIKTEEGGSLSGFFMIFRN